MADPNYANIAQQQFGWNGWNADNFAGYQNVLNQANQYQQQGGAERAGLRDYLQGQWNQFYEPQAQAYRAGMAQMGQQANATDADLVQDAQFQNYVRTGQLPQAQAPAAAPAQAQAAPTAQPAVPDRNNGLWQMLMERANQGLNVDRNNPAIRAQADAYSANEQRAARNFLGDVAERNPGANLRGEQRMAAERVGQRTGGFEAELVGREISAKRNEIAQALESMRGMLSQDQELAMREKLAQYDNALREKGLGLEQQRMATQNDQFLRELGLRDWDRQMYWDLLQRGVS